MAEPLACPGGVEAACPAVTALVLNWCGEEDTVACVRSLEATGYPALRILVIDNGSPDGSGARLRERLPGVEHLPLPENLGYAGGNNRGIEWALERGDELVLVLNNDTVVEPDSIARLVEAARSAPDVGAVGPKILRYDDPARCWFAGGRMSRVRALGLHEGFGERDRGGEEGWREVDFLTGCCLLAPAEILLSVGGFDEGFFAYVEDVDFCLRVTGSGRRLLYQPAARVLHKVPPEAAPETPFQIRQRDRNRRRVARRHFSAAERVRFALFFYPSRLVRLAQYALRGDRARMRAILDGMTTP